MEKFNKENVPRKLPKVLSEQEFTKIMEATSKSHHRLAFKLAFLCGLRITEIINLKPENFDRNRRLIFIEQGKWHKDRYVPYPVKFIKDKEIINLIPLKCKQRALQIVFKDKLKAATGRTDLHFHNLRHSFATMLLGKKVPLNEVQMWMGHNNIQTTMIYSHVSPEVALSNYEKLWE